MMAAIVSGFVIYLAVCIPVALVVAGIIHFGNPDDDEDMTLWR